MNLEKSGTHWSIFGRALLAMAVIVAIAGTFGFLDIGGNLPL